MLYQRQQLSLPPSICGNSAWNASMRKRAKEALLTPDKIKWREVRDEERDGEWRALCVCMCASVRVCVFLSVYVSEQRAMRPSILRGLKCVCKTLMIPCLLTKRPRYCLLLIHFSHITHTLSCIMCSRSAKEKII